MVSIKAGSIQKQLTTKDSAIKKYRKTVLGDGGLGALILYEMYNLFIQPVPGSIGKKLRRFFLPLFLQKIGSKAAIGSNVAIRKPNNILMGSRVSIDDFVTFNIKGDGIEISIDDEVIIRQRTILSCIGCKLKIGKETVVGKKCRLGSKKGLTVGNRCRLGDQTCIVGASHAYDRLDIPVIDQEIVCKGASYIGDDVIIGEKVTILEGVRVGNGATICPGSLVNKDVEPGSTVSGIPASRVSDRMDSN